MMKDFDEPGSLAPTGLFLGGLKYMVLQGEPGAVIRGKKVFSFTLVTEYSIFFHFEIDQTHQIAQLMWNL